MRLIHIHPESRVRVRTALGHILLPALFAACASGGGGGGQIGPIPSLNPTPTNLEYPGKFVWHDLITDDVEGAKRFYAELFGWEYRELDGGDAIHVVRANGREIATIVATYETEQDVEGAVWFSSVSVADVDAATGRARRGGTINVEPRDLPDRGRYAVVNDPAGARVVLLRASGGDPEDRDDFEPGEFLWTELWTPDARQAVAFYEDVLGYTPEFLGVEPRPYFLMTRDGAPRAGIGELPEGSSAEAAWLPYIAVADAQAIADRVESLGGELLIAPGAMIRGSAAVMADPSGALFAVQEWPVPDESGDTGEAGSG
ncbi:MAG: VOC family protein [Gemmatimonadota bacterium]|nr:VOC family protein [Gemmatimonadota bacterium]